MKPSIAVVGAGVAGLAVGYEIMERAERIEGGVDLICVDSADHAGGNIRSVREQGFLFESAANGFLDNAPATVTLVRRLGLESRSIKARPEAARRFIYRRGKLRSVPLTPGAFVSSGVLSPLGKLRLLAEPLIPARRTDDDESVYDFAARRIGPEAARVLVDAMVSGIYAGDVRRLSLPATFPRMRAMERDHGSLFRAMLAMRRDRRDGESAQGGPAGPGGTLTSFIDGMQELIDALGTVLGSRLRLGTGIERLSDLGRRGFRVHPVEGAPFDVDAVVLACPAWSAAAILDPVDRELARLLAGIPPAPVVVAHLGFRRDALGDVPTGFGFLIPRNQGPRALGVLWSSQIFDGRAPEGSVLFTIMLGGAHDSHVATLDDREIRNAVRADLKRTMDIVADPWVERLTRHPEGIPQYELGHVERLSTIHQRLGGLPGLWLAGNSLDGISINACVEQAPRIAEDVLEFLGYGASAVVG